MTDISNKCLWITGASSGIGAALATAASAAGAQVILSGRRTEALSDVAKTLAGPCLILPFEATDYPALDDITARAHLALTQLRHDDPDTFFTTAAGYGEKTVRAFNTEC